MKKIVMIVPNCLPIPAVKGGAVETLVTHIINENEKEKKVVLEIFSIADELTDKDKNKYKYTNIHYIKVPINKKLEKLKGKWNAFTSAVFKKNNIIEKCIIYGVIKILNINSKMYLKKILKFLKNMKYDYLIIEGGTLNDYHMTLRNIPYEKKIAHLHSRIKANNILVSDYKYFISVSEYVKKELIKDKRIKSQQVKVLENCVDADDFNKKITKEERVEIRNKYGIKENDIVLIYCGRTVKEKGIKELIEAYKMLNNNENIKLLIVGSSQFGNNVKTNYDKELQNLSKDISENIIYTGFIHNKELYKMYQIADISVVPSICEEAFGLVIVEAMYNKLPIITTKSGGIPEIVNNNCAYILDKNEELVINIKNSIEDLIENPQKRNLMGENGYQIVQKYNTKEYYKNFIKIIQEIENENRNNNISKRS